MAAEGSLNRSINKAQRHYSSLFTLPSLKTVLAANGVVCLLIGVLSSLVFPSSGGILAGLLLGSALVAMTFFSDLILSQVVLKDPIFVLRRVSVLSLSSWLFWLVLVVLGVVLGSQFGFLWWVKMCLLGFSVILTLRTIVFFATLSTSQTRRLIAILLEPFVCILPFVVFWAILNVPLIDFLPFLLISPFVAVGFGYLFLHFLNRLGKKNYGIASLPLFRAFILNWVTNQNGPLESILEKLGEDTDIDVSLLKFEARKPKAAVIVPLVHPGPFKNIGSSVLPALLKHAYEKEFGGDACTALGLLGHERNAASQTQNQKIIQSIIDAAKFTAHNDRGTPFVRINEGFVTASCQIFGKTAFLSFTLAPKTTEDLPQELDGLVREEAKKLGLDDAILINAHNSLTSINEIEASIENLHAVASKCLQKAVSARSYPLEVGTATVYPKEFTLKDGMGAGGITALVVKVCEQKTAYLIIDGNNMISGLREKILSELAAAGFEESEIFTTDTHSVSALTRGSRGYHPVGEAMDQATLITYLKQVAQTATNNLESCKVGSLRLVVPKVRVMGEQSIASLTVIVDQSIQKAKQIILPLFSLEGLLLILLLALV